MVSPPQSRDIREQESAAASHGAAAWTARPTQSWPAARRLMSSPHCERRAPIDTTDAAVHKTKRQAVSSVYSHAMSHFDASIVRYIDSCLQTWTIKLVCNKRKSALSESVVTESFYTEFNRNSAGANKKVRTNRVSVISGSVITKFYCTYIHRTPIRIVSNKWMRVSSDGGLSVVIYGIRKTLWDMKAADSK